MSHSGGIDPQKLFETLIAFIQADTWDKSRQIVEHHPELLSDQADLMLEQLIRQAQTENNEPIRLILEQYRELLRLCRQIGVDQAFSPLIMHSQNQIPDEIIVFC